MKKKTAVFLTLTAAACAAGLYVCLRQAPPAPQPEDQEILSQTPGEQTLGEQIPGEPTLDPVLPEALTADNASLPRSVTVNSSETVSAAPDIAEVVYSVRTSAKTAADCQAQNAESTAQVIGLLTELGVAEGSIQTSGFSLYPVYDYSGSSARITGYEASSTLTVSDLKIEGLGSLLSRSVSLGVNTVESITYQASGYDQSYQEALQKAVDAAYQKAQILAAASGAKVGGIITIQETSGYTQARYADTATAGIQNVKEAAMSQKDGAAADPMPGEIDVTASITAQYELTD